MVMMIRWVKPLLLGDDGIPATVTGGNERYAMENSQIKGDIFVWRALITQRFNKGVDENWGDFGAITYLLLKPGTDPHKLSANFQLFWKIMPKNDA